MLFTLTAKSTKKGGVMTVDQYTYIDQLYAEVRRLIEKDLKKQGVRKRLRPGKTASQLWNFRCYDFTRLSDRTLHLEQTSDR